MLNTTRIVHLKIKIQSISAEARIIRAEEQKAKAARRKAVCWRVKNPGRANEAESIVTATTELFWSLRDHRRGRYPSKSGLAETLRISHLAYGFLRGAPYASIEQKTDDPPDLFDVGKEAERFGGDPVLFVAWKRAAEEHLGKATPLGPLVAEPRVR
jgi:hypothetical protein